MFSFFSVLEVQYVKYIVEEQFKVQNPKFCENVQEDPGVLEKLQAAINGKQNLLLLDGKINILKGSYFRKYIASRKSSREIVLPVLKTELLENAMIEYFQKMASTQQKTIQNLYQILNEAVPELYPVIDEFVSDVNQYPNQLLEFFQFWQARRREWTTLPQYAPLVSGPITPAAALAFDQNYRLEKKKGIYKTVETDEATMEAEDLEGHDDQASMKEVIKLEPEMIQDSNRWFRGSTGALRPIPLRGCKRQDSDNRLACEYVPSTAASGSTDRSITSSNQDQDQDQVDDTSSFPVLDSPSSSTRILEDQSYPATLLKPTSSVDSDSGSLPLTHVQSSNLYLTNGASNLQRTRKISPTSLPLLASSNNPLRSFTKSSSFKYQYIPVKSSTPPNGGLQGISKQTLPYATLKSQTFSKSRTATTFRGSYPTPNTRTRPLRGGGKGNFF